jgi:glycosyltransferase involved in cell wall biosynthesis
MTAATEIVINSRVTAFAMGGQQRVAQEVMNRLPGAQALKPFRPLGGMKGHAWEQLMLPRLARGRLLWSPSATGPLLHRRQVVTIHDTAFFDCPEFFSPSFVRFYQALIPRLARRVAKVVTVSEFSRRRIAEWTGMKESDIGVIYNGIAPMFRRFAPPELEAARKALDLPGRFLLVQATSDRRKNLARTLDAWRSVVPDLPDDLHLVVSGNLGRAHVFGDASGINLDAPRLRTLGYVADKHMGPLMALAEGFVFASLYEGFGLPPLEAMACGTPVISGDATALPEVVGDAALLVDAASTEAIARAMRELSGNPDLRHKLRERGFARARPFTWDDAAARYIKVFENVR